MPAVSRTSLPLIVDAARGLLDAGGPDAVTMAAVAASVGVRGPSLYKHVDGRTALMRLVLEAAVAEFGGELAEAAAPHADPEAALVAAARAFRAFAHRSPHVFRLVFGPVPEDERPSAARLEAAAAPILDAVARMVPEPQRLPAARTVTAWANGFVSMELSGAFRMGGDVDEAFEWGLEAVVRAVRGA